MEIVFYIKEVALIFPRIQFKMVDRCIKEECQVPWRAEIRGSDDQLIGQGVTSFCG